MSVAGTLSDGHVVEAAQGQRGVRAPEQSQGVRRQGRGVRVVRGVGVALQEILGFGHSHLLFLDQTSRMQNKHRGTCGSRDDQQLLGRVGDGNPKQILMLNSHLLHGHISDIQYLHAWTHLVLLLN